MKSHYQQDDIRLRIIEFEAQVYDAIVRLHKSIKGICKVNNKNCVK